MNTRAWSGVLRMVVMLILALGVSGVNHLAVQESPEQSQEFPIDIQVLPPKNEPFPVQSTSADTSPAQPIRPESLPGTVSAVLVSASGEELIAEGRGQSSITLVVMDDRGYAGGWQVLLAAETSAQLRNPIVLDRYPHRTEVLSGQMPEGIAGPHGNRLSVGQQLQGSPMVMVAAPGAGHGTYRLQLGLTASRDYVPAPVSFVLTLPSAP